MTANSSRCPHGWDPALLLAYVEGTLSKGEVPELEAHLKECSWCREESASLSNAHRLLLENPEAFHPSAEALVRFVAEDEDPQSGIASHVRSCSQCADDVELIRRMRQEGFELPQSVPAMPRSLRERLQAEHGIASEGDLPESFVSKILHLLETRFRIPMLAMGTAAAVAVVIVLFLPRSAPFHEVPRTPGMTLPEGSSIVAKEKKSVPSELPNDLEEETKPLVTAEMERDEPAASSLAEQSEVKRESAGRAIPRKQKLRMGPRGYVAEEPGKPLGQQPSAQLDETLDRIRSSPPGHKEKPARRAYPHVLSPQVTPSSKPIPRHRGLAEHKGKPGLQLKPSRHARLPAPVPESLSALAGRHESIEVRIVDSEGRNIPWREFVDEASPAESPQIGDEARSLESHLSQRDDKAKDAFTRFGLGTAEKSALSKFLLLVRVAKVGEAYELEAKLLERSNNHVVRTIRECNVSEQDLRSRITGLVRRFVPTR